MAHYFLGYLEHFFEIFGANEGVVAQAEDAGLHHGRGQEAGGVGFGGRFGKACGVGGFGGGGAQGIEAAELALAEGEAVFHTASKVCGWAVVWWFLCLWIRYTYH